MRGIALRWRIPFVNLKLLGLVTAFATLLVLMPALTVRGQGPSQIDWTLQFGTSKGDSAYGVAVEGLGGMYLVGGTWSALPGQTHLGYDDAFVRKYDSAGNELWTRQFGTSEKDLASDVAGDTQGNIYVVGHTRGALPGQTNQGDLDAFVRKYDSQGNELWTRQFGSSGNCFQCIPSDSASGVAADDTGNLYVVGQSSGALLGQTLQGRSDVFVRKYDSQGNELWTHQFGTSLADLAGDVAVDSADNIYLFGTMGGSYYLHKYDRQGNELWTRQFGTAANHAAADVAVDRAGDVYVVGGNWSALPGQTNPGSFVRKYDPNGNELWTRQFGISNWDDFAAAVAADIGGKVSVVGRTGGTLPGQTSAGQADAFVRQYDSAGNELWTHQLGSAVDEQAFAVAVSAGGDVYMVGSTHGALPGQSSTGGEDAFVVKLGVPTQVDTTPPHIDSLISNPDSLWPPNHKMVPVTVAVSVSDNVDPAPSCQIISVSSNEPINGLGDGDTSPDWEITGQLTVQLRAERSGTGSGRVYTIEIRCTDASGNSSTKTAPVTVPKDQGQK